MEMTKKEFNKESLIRHLSVENDTECVIENKSREDFEEVDEILIDDIIYRKVSRAISTTEVDNATLDNILDNIKGLEDENFLLRQKLKSERERSAAENEEKALIKQQLEKQKKRMKEIQNSACIYNEYFHGFKEDDIKSRL